MELRKTLRECPPALQEVGYSTVFLLRNQNFKSKRYCFMLINSHRFIEKFILPPTPPKKNKNKINK